MRSEKQNETARRGSKSARPAAAKAGKKSARRAPKSAAGAKVSVKRAKAGVSAKAGHKPVAAPAVDEMLSLLLGPAPEELAKRRGAPSAAESTEARRAHVISVAHELFAKDGPSRTTISDVCRAAQITPSVFYALFGSKEGLFDQIGESKRREAEPMVVPILEAKSTVREKIRALLEAYLFRLAGKWRDSAKIQLELIAESMHNPELRDTMAKRRTEMNAKLRELIEEGQRAGEIDATLDPCAVVDVLGALFIGMQVTRVMDAEFDHARYATAANSLVMGAFWRCDEG